MGSDTVHRTNSMNRRNDEKAGTLFKHILGLQERAWGWIIGCYAEGLNGTRLSGQLICVLESVANYE